MTNAIKQLPKINLLPWRAMWRQEQKRLLGIKVGGVSSLTLLLVVLLHLFIAMKINHQQSRNQLLETEIKTFDKKITEIYQLKKEKENLLAHMAIIEKLQLSRYETVNFFNALNRVLPSGVVLEEIKRQGEAVTLVGNSESNARISELMKNIEHSSLFVAPRLKEIKSAEKSLSEKHQFQLQLMQHEQASTLDEVLP